MKRKIVLICILLVISILVIGKYKYLKNEEPIQDIKESNIAIMVYDDESDSYVKQNSVPKGAKYSLNETLTKCEAGGKVTNYNKANGTLKYVLPQMDYCYVYFDVDNTPSYAIYSETDNSLIFYKNNDTVGEEYNGRLVTAKYDGIEASLYTYDSNTSTPSTPWYEYANEIKTVSVANEIMPISTAMWFRGLQNVESINLINLNTSNVTTMERMFDRTGYNSQSFSVDLGNTFDTSNVTTMFCAFQNTGYNAINFSLDLGDKFNTSKVIDMKGIFNKTGMNSAIFTLNLGSKFDTSNVIDMTTMFGMIGYSNSEFTLDLGDKFDTSNVINMNQMFAGMGYSNPNFVLDLGDKFDTSKVTNMYRMFERTGKVSSVFELDVSSFIINSNCNITEFALYSSSKIIFGSGWANATLVQGMFKQDSSTPLEIVNAPANILAYDFAADNRVPTFTTM